MREIWKEEEVEEFFKVAFSQFRYRSLGLLGAFLYELPFKLEYCIPLKWSQVNTKSSSVVVNSLVVPLSPNLNDMMEQQRKDLDFQKLVFPHFLPVAKRYQEFTTHELTRHTNLILKEAGLPRSYNMGSLRWTALAEMWKDEVPRQELMALMGSTEFTNLEKQLSHDSQAAHAAIEKRIAKGKLVHLKLKGKKK